MASNDFDSQIKSLNDRLTTAEDELKEVTDMINTLKSQLKAENDDVKKKEIDDNLNIQYNEEIAINNKITAIYNQITSYNNRISNRESNNNGTCIFL